VTTAQKITAMRDHLATIDPDEMPGPARDFALNLQIAAGLGFDPFDFVLPDDPNELDEMIDGAIGLLINLRGDDLPPLDIRPFLPESRDDGDVYDDERAGLENGSS
jgi:hypothetical protein